MKKTKKILSDTMMEAELTETNLRKWIKEVKRLEAIADQHDRLTEILDGMPFDYREWLTD